MSFSIRTTLFHKSLHGRRHFFQTTNLSAHRQIGSTLRSTSISRPTLFKGLSAVGLGLGISALSTPRIICESPSPFVVSSAGPAPSPGNDLPPPPSSVVNVYELGFGTVAGICAGVFIKKGAKAVAFFCGGIFVLLQYFGSFGVVKVDWQAVGTKFQHLFYTRDPKSGNKATPTIYTVWVWMVDFLTADFQPRASFIAGLALGLRIG